jgi:hypothetical protein
MEFQIQPKPKGACTDGQIILAQLFTRRLMFSETPHTIDLTPRAPKI